MMIVSDVEDVFVPLLDGFLVKLSESEAIIDRFVFASLLSIYFIFDWSDLIC